jgi:hypothetical protein
VLPRNNSGQEPVDRPPTDLEEYQALAKHRFLHDAYILLQALLLVLVLVGFYWSASRGPLHEYVFSSAGNLAGFVTLVVFTPFFLIKVFPLPYSMERSSRKPSEALAGERLKVAIMVVVDGLLANEFLFAVMPRESLRITGYVLCALSLFAAGYLLRNERQGVIWNFWCSVKGIKPPRLRFKDFISWPRRQRLFPRRETSNKRPADEE